MIVLLRVLDLEDNLNPRVEAFPLRANKVVLRLEHHLVRLPMY